MMKKLIAGVSAFGVSAMSVFAQGTQHVIDTQELKNNVTTLQSDIIDFFSDSIGPAVLAIIGGAFLIWLVFVIFRWIRRAAK